MRETASLTRSGRRLGALLAGALALVLAAFLLLRTGEDPGTSSAGGIPRAPDVRGGTPLQPGSAPPQVPAAAVAEARAPPAEAREPREWPLRFLTNAPGATVTVRFLLLGGEPDPEPVTKIADATGLAGFDLPAPDEPLHRIDVEARAPGRGALPFRLPPRVPQEVRIVLLPLAVRGRVFGADGIPLKGAGVQIPDHRVVWTDAGGRFEDFAVLSGKEDFEYTVCHPAHLPATFTVRDPIEDLVVRLERGQEVRGSVTFPDGKPVPGMEVVAKGLPWYVRSETGEDGRYTLGGLRPGEVWVRLPMTGEERLVQAGAAEADLVMRFHLVRIHLVDEGGRPFRWGAVQVSCLHEGRVTGGSTGTSGENGVFTVHLLPGQRISVAPAVPGYSRDPTEFPIEGEPGLHDVTVVLRPAGPPGSVELRAIDDEGRPLPRAVLTLGAGAMPLEGWYENEVALDGQGRAAIEEIPPGPGWYRLAASKAHPLVPEVYWIPTGGEIRVESGRATRLDAVLPVGGRVALTLLDASGNPAIPGEVSLRDESGRTVLPVGSFLGFSRNQGWQVAHFHAGRVLSTPPVAAGRYTLLVKRGNDEPIIRDVEVVRGRTVEVEIRLDR